MYFICTGEPPFRADQIISDEHLNFWLELMTYQDSATFPEMADFLSKLMVVDAENRLTSAEALSHPWMNAAPYMENNTLKRLQMKLATEEELLETKAKLSHISATMNKQMASKSPLLEPRKSQEH